MRTVWIDDREIGSQNSLVAPHVYDLGQIPAGNHRLTVRVDNRMILPYRPDAHSVSDSLGQSWNGIVGAMELRATPLVWIEELQVYPDFETRSAVLKGKIGNATGKAGSDRLIVGILPKGATESSYEPLTIEDVSWSEAGGSFEVKATAGHLFKSWDEFSPTVMMATA